MKLQTGGCEPGTFEEDFEASAAICLAALYLRGVVRPFDTPARQSIAVLSCLRREAATLKSAASVLRRDGFGAEAAVLEAPQLLAYCEKLRERDRILTAACDGYPQRWLSALGGGAPPALWRAGAMPAGPFTGVVGSRRPPVSAERFAGKVAAKIIEGGLCVVSGGAVGCDRAAAKAAMHGTRDRSCLLEILPMGIDVARSEGNGLATRDIEAKDSCWLSVVPPRAGFTSQNAMERNALIYACTEMTVVAHARFREGGSWHGAVSAMRRRLTTVLVRSGIDESDDAASRALVALGAFPLCDAENLFAAANRLPAQAALAI